jgi:hypothetical protein
MGAAGLSGSVATAAAIRGAIIVKQRRPTRMLWDCGGASARRGNDRCHVESAAKRCAFGTSADRRSAARS